MKIATWNVQRPASGSGAHASALTGEMREVAADVWILTETHEDLTPGEGYERSMSGQPDRDSKPGERWAAIWSKLPVVARPPTSDPARTVAARLRPRSGADIVVYGTVLPWLGSKWRAFDAKGGVAFAQALAVQRADWIRLREDNPGCELVVAGDLNQDFTGKHFYGSRRNRKSLLDALGECGLKPAVVAGGDPVREHAPTRASVDHICVPSESMRWQRMVVSSWPLSSWPPRHLSDHFGLAVDVGAA